MPEVILFEWLYHHPWAFQVLILVRMASGILAVFAGILAVPVCVLNLLLWWGDNVQYSRETPWYLKDMITDIQGR